MKIWLLEAASPNDEIKMQHRRLWLFYTKIVSRNLERANEFWEIHMTRLISTIQPSFNSNYRNTREKGKRTDIHIHFFHSVCQTLGKNVRKLPKEKEEEHGNHPL